MKTEPPTTSKAQRFRAAANLCHGTITQNTRAANNAPRLPPIQPPFVFQVVTVRTNTPHTPVATCAVLPPSHLGPPAGSGLRLRKPGLERARSHRTPWKLRRVEQSWETWTQSPPRPAGRPRFYASQVCPVGGSSSIAQSCERIQQDLLKNRPFHFRFSVLRAS